MKNDIVLILKAASFAAEKHRGQLRKDVEATPYINHPLEVARILAEEGAVSDPEVIAAALLHDTIEDTETSESELAALFGVRVASMVAEVTDDKGISKVDRKQMQIEHAPSKTKGAAMVKLADKLSNVRDVLYRPPSDWSLERRRQYLQWSKRVVNALPIQDQHLKDIFMAEVDAGLTSSQWVI
jgi:guanosine-3',5'-bis(diphosphate) 3'-pyrophosphohydrolase